MAGLSAQKCWIGTTKSLQQYEVGWGGEADVRVAYEDKDGTTHVVTICVNGARLLAKALNANANLIRPPKKRRS